MTEQIPESPDDPVMEAVFRKIQIKDAMSFSKKVEYHVDQWSVYNHVFRELLDIIM